MSDVDKISVTVPQHIQDRINARETARGYSNRFGKQLSENSREANYLATSGGGLSDHLANYNARFFVMPVGGSPLVFDEDAKEIVNQAMTFAHFKQLYQNQKIGSDCLPVEWLKSPARRTLTGEIVHAPRKPYGVVGDDFNTYKGPHLTPEEGDCSGILDHIRDCLCSGDSDQFNYYIGWLAHLFQRPYERPGVAIIQQSIEGTGKSITTGVIRNIWGQQHSIILDKQVQLTGDFNAHLSGKMFVCIEETSTARNIAATEQLKNLVTAEILTINPKGKPIYQIDHFGRVTMNTNHNWAITAGSDSRRWFIPDISNHQVGNRAYFRELASYVADLNVQKALLHYLLNVDLSAFDPAVIPDTQALKEQRSQTLSRLDMPLDWLKTMLSNGFIDGIYDGGTEWQATQFEIPRKKLRDSYVDYSARSRSAPNFDAAIKSIKNVISLIDGPQRRVGDVRQRTYLLPSLGTATSEFEASTRIRI